MGAYEVTQEEFARVMDRNPSVFKDDVRNPVEQVAWIDAVTFCTKLSQRPEEKQAGRVYRLPTDAEWEYACRAGTKTVYHFGDTLTPGQANYGGNMNGKGEIATAPNKPVKVGSYPKNPWGLHDMHGNVWEWCLDDGRVFSAAAVEDPRGAETAGGHRVLRGGGWNWAGAHARSARRFPYAPGYRGGNVGFRVVWPR